MEIEELVERVAARIPRASREEIERKLKTLIEEFKVPENEAVKTVVNSFARVYGNEKPALVKIAELPGVNGSVNVRFKVLRKREIKSEKVSTKLLIGDETGTLNAIVMKGATAVEFVPRKVYTVKNAFNGTDVLVITKMTSVLEEDTDLKVKPFTYEGAIVAIGKNSGIVLKCPTCETTLLAGACPKHGKVRPKASYEARILVDNGHVARTELISNEELEKISGLSIEEATELRGLHASNEVVFTELISRLIGRYVRVERGDVTRVELVR